MILSIVPQINITSQPLANDTICLNGTISQNLTISHSIGIGNVSYQWIQYPNTPVGTNSPTFNPGVLGLGAYQFFVIVDYDGNGCSPDTSNITQIVIIPDPIVTSPCNIPDTVCKTSTGSPSAFLPLTTIANGGIGIYNYQWWVNDGSGFVIATGPDATTASYTPASDVVGTFNYFCVVSQNPNSANCSVNTDTCTLVVNPAPIVVTPPQNDSLCVDGIIPDLYVNPTGPGTITYQWFLINIGGDISVATTPTYSPPTNVNGIFEYYCVVSFSSGGCSVVTSSTITIVILPDPTIDTQPLTNDTICEGGTIATPLTVSYTTGTGVGNVSYQWYDSTGAITGANNNTFTPLTSTLNTGNYYYWAIISFDGNDCQDAISDSAQIVIIPDPIVTSPCNIPDTVCKTSTGSPSAFLPLTTIANGGIGIYNYQWWVNDGSGFVIATGPDATTASYTPASDVVGTFNYFCVVSQNPNSANCSVNTDTCTLVVNPAPIVVTPPQNDSLCVDGIIPDLYVNPTGPGTITYQWFLINIGGDISVATTPTYSPPTNVNGIFEYYCVVSFSSGGCSVVTSSTITIVILPDPTIDTQPLTNDTICEGGTIATPLTVSYTTGTGVGNVSYQWYDSTGAITGANNNTFTPLTSTLNTGNYYYWAIISFDGNDCQDAISDSAQIVIIGDPIADFDLWSGNNTDSLCENHNQNPIWINQSSGTNISSYTWEIINSSTLLTVFGPITVTDSLAPIIPFLQSGNQSNGYEEYDLILSVENACSTPTDTHRIIIEPLPDPSFDFLIGNISTNIICLGSAVTVSYGNTPPPSPFSATDIYNDSIKVDWGDGSLNWYSGPANCGNLTPASNLVCFDNANHQYLQVGLYNVCVTAYNECDSITTCDTIEVINSNILASVQIDTAVACVNESIVFFDNSSFTAPNQTEIYLWWNIDPNININDYLQPNGTIPPDSSYNQSTSGTGYSVSHQYDNPGIYYILYQMETGPIPPCNYDYSNIVLDSIIIYPEPSAHFINPIGEEACLGEIVTFEYDSEIPAVAGISGQFISNIIWEVISPSGVITNINGIPNIDLDLLVDDSGIWIISIIVESNKGCSAFFTDSILVHEPPLANYIIIPDSACSGNGLTYFDASSSLDGSGIINQYLWDFSTNANPNISNGVIVSTEFLSNGNWFVDLIVIDNFGCSDTITDTVVINESMTAFFSATTECLGNSTIFESAYPLSSPNANSWNWDFGDGLGTSNIQNPTYIYNAPGDYLVTLVISDTNYIDSTLCMDVWTDTIHVNALPSANFIADTVCWLSGTSFIDSSFAVEAGSSLLFTRDWYFGNDSLIDATSLNTSFTFDSCGLNIYDVSLVVEDNLGCKKTVTKNISISCPPIAQFSIDTSCIGTESYFQDDSEDGTFPIINYNWYNYGNGFYSPTPNSNINYSTFVFNSIGVQDTTILIVSDPFGCSDTAVNFAYIRDLPNASFYTVDTNYCQNTPIQFFENSFTNGIIESQNWIFSTANPSLSTVPDPTVTFTSHGNWNVQLNVIDEYGCADDTLVTIEIDNLPNVNFEWDDVPGSACSDTLICFNSLSTQSNNGNPLFSYVWDFGDGFFGSDSSLCHNFNGVDPFSGACVEVNLTVTDSFGCSESHSNIITIYPIPDVDDLYVTPAICQGEYLVLQEFTQFITDQCIDDNIDHHIWYFNGDSISNLDSTTFTPDFNLSTDSSHYITLEAYTEWGCSNEYTITIDYNKIPELFGPLVTYPNGQCGDTVTFNFTSFPTDYNLMNVTINDPIHSNAFENIPTNTTSFNVTSPHAGVFDISISLENTITNCKIDSLFNIYIYPNPTAKFSPIDSLFCYEDSKEIYFTDSSFIANKDLFESHSSDITEIEDWIWYLDATRSNDIDINQNTSAIFESLSDSITSYIIELIVQTNYGCLDTAFGEIAVLSTPEADFAIPTEDVPNYGTYLLDATSTTTGIGNYASPELYDYNWIISDGPYDLVSILNTKGDNDKFYFPSPDSLYYQFNYFLYGENDYTEICLIVGNSYDISSAIEKTCQDTICKNVRIQAWGELFVPNALYPEASDDGSRVFLPKGKSLVDYNLQIFDKFGNLVWENNELNASDGSPKTGWDGTSNGSLLPQGTYIWKIAAKFINGPWNGIGDNNKKTGTVYLIR